MPALTLSSSAGTRPPPHNPGHSKPRGELVRLFLSLWAQRGFALMAPATVVPCLLGISELLLLPDREGWGVVNYLDFFLLAAGLSGLVTVSASVTLAGFGAWAQVLSRHTSHAKAIAVVVLGVASLPYALWLGHFTFSGPTVVGLSYQPVLVATATLGVAMAFALALLLYLHRPTRGLPRGLLGVGLLLVAGASLLTNREVIPGQYVPLHTLLSISTGLVLLLAFTEFLPPLAPRGLRSRLFGLTCGIGLACAPPLALHRLPTAPKVGAVITQSSVTPRYLIFNYEESDTQAEAVDAELLARIKPRVVAPRALLAREERSLKRPNIVLFFVDNMSPSRTGYLGYRANPTTPNLDGLANAGAIFTQAYSVINHTRLFATSLLMGHYSHLSAPDRPPPSLVRTAVTKLLHHNNYHVMVQNWFELSRSANFKPRRWGIDTYIRPPTPEEEAATNDWPPYSLSSILETLDQHLEEARRTDQPVFLWLHLSHAHGVRGGDEQYRADPEFSFGPTLDDRYDGALASADNWFAAIKRLLDDKLTSPENTYYISGSDHGSGIRRFRKKVSKTSWQDHVHVPLAITGPGIPRGTFDYTVDCALDLSATVLDLAGLDPPDDYDGISLLPLVTGEWKPQQPRPVVVATPPEWEGVILGKMKLVKNKGTLSLFDLAQDPDERKDIADKDPELARRLGRLASEVITRRSRTRAGDKAKSTGHGSSNDE